MNIQVNLDNIPRVREHAQQARIDMLTTMLAGKFGNQAKDPELLARLAKMDVTQLEAVALRLVALDDLDAVLDGALKATPGAGPKR